MTRWSVPLACLLLCGLVGLPRATRADRVTPSERVRSGVVIRAKPGTGGAPLGSLRKGDEVALLESGEHWHRVALKGDRVGYVSAHWTRIIEEEPVAAAPEPLPALDPLLPLPRPSFLERVANSLSQAFGREAPVDIEITQPQVSHYHVRHPDPLLPVAGYAAAGEGGRVDLVLAIDGSTSANEFCESDVDGDGVLEDDWAGDDSIYQAQVLAARRLVAALRRLPGNARGERVRVAVISFSGDDRYREHPPDRDLELDTLRILGLAQRDARRHIALTSDYDAVDAALTLLAQQRPAGMTDFAAAIGLGVMELSGLTEAEAAAPADDALRVIDFLTDGMPSLPYAREQAERAARYAARLADEQGIRVNVFELGHNAVTRRHSETGSRVADITGGTFTSVERPGDILKVLAATSLTFVDRVRLTNRTTGQRTRYVSTGLDGSFYGEVPLREGPNEIDVAAILYDGRERSVSLRVDYHAGAPTPELEKQLRLVRERNESLIEEIRKRLALEMEREKQRKELEVGAGPE